MLFRQLAARRYVHEASVRARKFGRGRDVVTMTSGLWYRAELRDALVDGCQVATIREHFAEALGAAGWPDGACLFLSARHGRGRRVRVHDRAVAEAVFFSPASIAAVPHLIVACGAGPSPPPDRACATLLVGNEGDWDLLPRPVH